MNIAMIIYLLGRVMQVVGAMMTAPFIVSLIYGERSGLYFLICGVLTVTAGTLLTIKKPAKSAFYAKEGFVMTALSWVLLSALGALPLYFSGEIPSYTDALFECISGFTTTGASIVPAVEDLSKSVNFWRCFIQLIGGMGVLVFLLALLPVTGAQDLYIMKAESPGPDVGKLMPRVRQTAFYLYIIYFALTAAMVIALLIAGMPFYDSLCAAFATTSTGGFGIKNASLGAYDANIQYVVSVFLFFAGINYNFYFYIWMKRVKEAINIEEVKAYTGIFAAAVFLISMSLMIRGNYDAEPAFRYAFFQVGSIMTTAGFSTFDFDTWPALAREILIFLMLIGGCAGSTCGGVKISRVILYLKMLGREIMGLCHPKSVKTIRMDGKRVEDDVLRSSLVFLAAYAIIFAVSILVISFDDYDFTTNFTAVASALGNIGPGFSLVGPSRNFAHFSVLSKCVLMFDMLAGRLEIFPMLVILTPATWKRK